MKRPKTTSSMMMGDGTSWILVFLIIALCFGILALNSCSAEGTSQDRWPCPKDIYCVSTTYSPDGEELYSNVVCECRDPKADEDGNNVITRCYDLDGGLVCEDRSDL